MSGSELDQTSAIGTEGRGIDAQVLAKGSPKSPQGERRVVIMVDRAMAEPQRGDKIVQ